MPPVDSKYPCLPTVVFGFMSYVMYVHMKRATGLCTKTAVFTVVVHYICPTSSHPTYVRLILILPFCLHQGLTSGPFRFCN
jgi:hypothetical protein